MTTLQLPLSPHAGVHLDAGRVRYELAIRGATGATVAERAGVAPNTVSRILCGRPVSIASLRAIARALNEMPVLPGVAELLAGDPRNTANPTLEMPKASSPKLDALDEGGQFSAPIHRR